MIIEVQNTVRKIVEAIPQLLPHLSEETKRMLTERKAVGDYGSIRDRFWDAVYNVVDGFLTSNQQTGTAAREMAAALSQAYIEAADTAYVDGGGDLPLDDETAAWAREQLDAQLGFADSLFQTLRDLRKESETDSEAQATARAEGYSNSLDGFYNQMRLRGAGNKMLTFVQLRDTKESCEDCVRLRGQRHRASWWIANDLVPPKGGGLACSGGGNCGDGLVDDDGNEFTI